MRLIDQIAARERRSDIEDRRSLLSGTSTTARSPEAATTRAQLIGLAQYLADCEANGRTLGSLLASEQREYDRRTRSIAAARKAEPTTHSLSAARLRLTSKEHEA